MNETGVIIGFTLLVFNGFNACAHRDQPMTRTIAIIVSFVGFIMVILSAV